MFMTVLVLSMWGLGVSNVCDSTSASYVGLGVGNIVKVLVLSMWG